MHTVGSGPSSSQFAIGTRVKPYPQPSGPPHCRFGVGELGVLHPVLYALIATPATPTRRVISASLAGESERKPCVADCEAGRDIQLG